MLNLIVKDIALQKKTILFGFAYIIIMALTFSNGGAAMLTAGTFALTFLFIQTPCAHDDKSRAEGMLLSLPIRRSTVVNAKYASVPLYVLIAVFEYSVLYGVLKLTGLPIHMAAISLENLTGLLAAVVFFAALFYPIFFRYGYMKTRYINIVLFAGLFAAGSALTLAIGGEDALLGGGFAEAVTSQPGWLVACALLGLMLALMTVSYCLSLRFYNRREF